MKKQPGTYILRLFSSQTWTVDVGALGAQTITAGYYLYVGSAFGPGGVYSRGKRHLAPTKIRFWHIDYLTTELSIDEIWFSYQPSQMEHQWAACLSQMPGAEISIPGFGSSDCQCPAHLYFYPQEPTIQEFLSVAEGLQVVQRREEIWYSKPITEITLS